MRKEWKKSKYNMFDDAWEKNIALDIKDCQHSEREGNYCPHCEIGTKTIEIYVSDDQSIGSPNNGLWYVKVTGIPKKWFKTKTQALRYARLYMRMK